MQLSHCALTIPETGPLLECEAIWTLWLQTQVARPEVPPTCWLPSSRCISFHLQLPVGCRTCSPSGPPLLSQSEPSCTVVSSGCCRALGSCRRNQTYIVPVEQSAARENALSASATALQQCRWTVILIVTPVLTIWRGNLRCVVITKCYSKACSPCGRSGGRFLKGKLEGRASSKTQAWIGQ